MSNINNNYNLELTLLKLLFNYELHKKYYGYIKGSLLTQELEKIFQTITLFHEKHPTKNISKVGDLEVFFYTLFPATNQKERTVFGALFEKIGEQAPDTTLGEDYLKSLRMRQEASKIALLALDVSTGQVDWEKLSTAVLESPRTIQEVSPDTGLQPISNNLFELRKEQELKPGLKWRLKCLNRALGELRQGHYGFIFARPETGKSSFLASEATYMAQHLPEGAPPIIWLNNEQPGIDVLGYLYRATFGLTDVQLNAKLEEIAGNYDKLLGKKLLVINEPAIYRRDVEELIKKTGASLIIFDQIDAIRGFNDDREDLRLGAIYTWARELAKTVCPVIGVCQAGESGANKRYLEMEDVVNSKTSKQATADWICGIGALQSEGYSHMRHLHLVKNKLPGGKDQRKDDRHGKFDVIIHPETARYEDCPE